MQGINLPACLPKTNQLCGQTLGSRKGDEAGSKRATVRKSIRFSNMSEFSMPWQWQDGNAGIILALTRSYC
jgi:hypothetical protein